MTNTLKFVGVAVVGLVLGLLLSAGLHTDSKPVSGIYEPSTCVGTACTLITQIQKGTGSLIMPSFTVAASSTVAADIAVAGVQSGDTVFAQFVSGSANGAGWLVTQATASTTSGYITLRIVNNTGASAVIPATLASSTQYLTLR